MYIIIVQHVLIHFKQNKLNTKFNKIESSFASNDFNNITVKHI